MDMNTILLGCNSPVETNIQLPLTTKPQGEAYLVRPNHPINVNGKELYILYLWVRITVRKMEFEGLTILVKLTILSLACQREGEKL
jgi:hypothetical protein